MKMDEKSLHRWVWWKLGMQMAIRREAAAIFLGGGYLKAWMALMEYRMSRYVPDELAFGQSYLWTWVKLLWYVSCWVLLLEVIVNQSHDELLLESLDIAVEEALYQSNKNPQPSWTLYTGQIGMPLDLISFNQDTTILITPLLTTLASNHPVKNKNNVTGKDLVVSLIQLHRFYLYILAGVCSVSNPWGSWLTFWEW